MHTHSHAAASSSSSPHYALVETKPLSAHFPSFHKEILRAMGLNHKSVRVLSLHDIKINNLIENLVNEWTLRLRHIAKEKSNFYLLKQRRNSSPIRFSWYSRNLGNR